MVYKEYAKCCSVGSYKCYKSIPMPEQIKKYRKDNPLCAQQFKSIGVDMCIANEIQFLWSKGITTTGCCCGHGRPELSYIGVIKEDIKEMQELGYEQTFNYDLQLNENFYAKSTVSKDTNYRELRKKTILALCGINKPLNMLKIGTKLYMIPTERNGLQRIQDYTLLDIRLSDIGIRYSLSLNKKQSGVEPFYCASEEMFGVSIFSTEAEAQAKLDEIRRK